jgi:hypothetical protein
MPDLHGQYGLIEVSLFELIVLAIAGYQLWSVRKSLKETREKNRLKAQETQSTQQDQDPT